jgi:molybdate transport system ATP-binding protein
MSTVANKLEQPGIGLHLLTGPNGAGKSSLARELAGRVPGAQLISAEAQQAFYETQLANDEGNFQKSADTSIEVRELLGERARSHPLFEAFRLEGLWDRSYRKLSTGESRKLLLLRAVLDAPSLLVLDEPFDGLDIAARADLPQTTGMGCKVVPVIR